MSELHASKVTFANSSLIMKKFSLGRPVRKASSLCHCVNANMVSQLTLASELLNTHTVLFITDKPSRSQELPIRTSLSPQKLQSVTTPRRSSATVTNGASHGSPSSMRKALRDLGTDTADPSRVDLSRFRNDALRIQEDPLPDEAFIPTHKRAERKEKNLRNIEKEHAMFEKGQLERLLDGLRGPDWLKVMGLTGITDGEKRTFEAKRDHFVQGVKSLLRKFDSWKEQEKELKSGREHFLSGVNTADNEEDESPEDQDEEEAADDAEDAEAGEGVDELVNESDTHAGFPSATPSEIDAEAWTQQAIQERKAIATSHSQHKAKQTTMDRFLLQPRDSDATKTIKSISSFYEKSYLRDAALSARRRGRVVLAFGQPLPEPDRREFELPSDVLTTDVLASNARQRKSLKRKASPD